MADAEQGHRFEFGRDRDEVDKAIDNIDWAKAANSSGDTLKANAHLHRAKELLTEYRDSRREE